MTITRVDYRERQRLTASDLEAEQDYRLALAGRHHLTHHDWGVVRGLHIALELDSTNVPHPVLEPGVAIDGYGREIVVPEAVPITCDRSVDRQCVLLDYCESPQKTPPCRDCKEDPAPRIGHGFKQGVRNGFVSRSASFAQVPGARGAGRFPGLAPWPVLVGCIERLFSGEGGETFSVDTTAVRYTRARAALVRSPTQRAMLQLGLAGRSDVYEFLLSTATTAGMTRRVGIDRDGIIHVWRPLRVVGPDGVGLLELSDGKQIAIRAVMPSRSRVVIDGRYDPSMQVLTASLRDLHEHGADAPALPEANARVYAKWTLPVELNFGGVRSAEIRLLRPARVRRAPADTARAVKVTPPRGGLKEAPVAESLQAIHVDLTRTGGSLSLVPREDSTEETALECGDVDRSRSPLKEPASPILEIRPAQKIEADPLAREIHAVFTSKPTDSVPETELRLSGGGEDERDTSSRLAIGALVKDGGALVWNPVLRMKANRRVEIVGGSGGLHVKRAIYLPPIGKKDPLMPDLMAMSFIGGLRQVGKFARAKATLTWDPSLNLTRSEPGGPLDTFAVARNGTIKYQIDVVKGSLPGHAGSAIDYDFQRCFEIVTGTAGSHAMAFRSIKESELGAFHPVDHFIHPADRVRLEVVVLVKELGVTGVTISNPLFVEFN